MNGMIPECYDPICQEERRQMEMDRMRGVLPCCALCRRTLYPGGKFYTARHQVVCPSCLEELEENEEIVELDEI